MHSPSHPSILGCCIHVEVSTTIVKITLAVLQVPITFLVYLRQCIGVHRPSPGKSIIIIYILSFLPIFPTYPLSRYRFPEHVRMYTHTKQIPCCARAHFQALYIHIQVKHSPVVKILYTSMIDAIKSQLESNTFKNNPVKTWLHPQ